MPPVFRVSAVEYGTKYQWVKNHWWSRRKRRLVDLFYKTPQVPARFEPIGGYLANAEKIVFPFEGTHTFSEFRVYGDEVGILRVQLKQPRVVGDGDTIAVAPGNLTISLN